VVPSGHGDNYRIRWSGSGHDASGTMTPLVSLTALTAIVSNTLPTLETLERWDFHTGGSLVPSAWRSTDRSAVEDARIDVHLQP